MCLCPDWLFLRVGHAFTVQLVISYIFLIFVSIAKYFFILCNEHKTHIRFTFILCKYLFILNCFIYGM